MASFVSSCAEHPYYFLYAAGCGAAPQLSLYLPQAEQAVLRPAYLTLPTWSLCHPTAVQHGCRFSCFGPRLFGQLSGNPYPLGQLCLWEPAQMTMVVFSLAVEPADSCHDFWFLPLLFQNKSAFLWTWWLKQGIDPLCLFWVLSVHYQPLYIPFLLIFVRIVLSVLPFPLKLNNVFSLKRLLAWWLSDGEKALHLLWPLVPR